MFIKRKTIVEPTIHSSLEVKILAVTNKELQIQVDRGDEDFFFDLHKTEVEDLRNAFNEFLGEK
ncbi:hypothetical protein [Roseivirga seohaensis]|uniref:hypothetical protein n=1 Tax=Roseivirga seohaensis TaxID=1914963 RepID=UPI003BAA4645